MEKKEGEGEKEEDYKYLSRAQRADVGEKEEQLERQDWRQAGQQGRCCRAASW